MQLVSLVFYFKFSSMTQTGILVKIDDNKKFELPLKDVCDF